MVQDVSRVRGEGKPVDLTKPTATDRQGNKIGGIVGAVVGLADLVHLQPDVMVDAGQLQCLGVPEAVCQQLVESFRQLNWKPVTFNLHVEGQDDLTVSIVSDENIATKRKIQFGQGLLKKLNFLDFKNGQVTGFVVFPKFMFSIKEFLKYQAAIFPNVRFFHHSLFGEIAGTVNDAEVNGLASENTFANKRGSLGFQPLGILFPLMTFQDLN